MYLLENHQYLTRNTGVKKRNKNNTNNTHPNRTWKLIIFTLISRPPYYRLQVSEEAYGNYGNSFKYLKANIIHVGLLSVFFFLRYTIHSGGRVDEVMFFFFFPWVFHLHVRVTRFPSLCWPMQGKGEVSDYWKERSREDTEVMGRCGEKTGREKEKGVGE